MARAACLLLPFSELTDQSPGGQRRGVAAGRLRVEAEGAIVGGVLVARKIDLLDGNDASEVDAGGHGVVGGSRRPHTLIVRGVTLHHKPGPRHEQVIATYGP